MDIKIIKINHITVASPKSLEKEMLDFYTHVLGFKLIEHPSQLDTQYKVVWLDRDNIRLHIDFRDKITQVGLERHFALEVENIDAIRNFFESNNVTIKEDVEVPYCTRFDIVDPAGNYIEIMELKQAFI